MKKYYILPAVLCLAAGMVGCEGKNPVASKAQGPKVAVTFDVTDEAGHWFDTGVTLPGGSSSLAIVQPGDRVRFLQTKSAHGPGGANGPSRVESLHTVTSLIWPAGSTPAERLDQDAANKDDHDVVLRTPGLHVFVCKLHPYMLAGVIVDDPTTTGLDIGDNLHLFGVTHTVDVRHPANDANAFTSNSNLGLRLLRAFFVVTSPSNWKDYTKVDQPYRTAFPPVPVRVNPVGALDLSATGGVVDDLNAALQSFFDGENIDAQTAPTIPGIGEVWVDTQYEVSQGKGDAYPSTITVVDAETWQVKRKIALPGLKMNNAHNMWASHDQNEIYQTEWHGKSLYVLNRADGSLIQELVLDKDPAHVMTRVDTEQVHVGLNGGDSVVELNRNAITKTLSINRNILVQGPGDRQAQPHAHWMGFDSLSMVTPNSNTGDSTLFDFTSNSIAAKNTTGPLPIAASMDPASTRYYVSNYLGHSISVMCGPSGVALTCGGALPGQKIVDISLLQHYNPITGAINGAVGGLPIQTPVSPDGRFVVTGNTLTGTITIIDTSLINPADPVASQAALVKMLPCDPGCHGVNFGAKAQSESNPAGGYYAYVTSKFANRLIVYDIDPDNDGNASDAQIAGSIVLVDNGLAADKKDDTMIANFGMGGQGVLPVPNVYNGWVQKLPPTLCDHLSPEQKNPFPSTGLTQCQD